MKVSDGFDIFSLPNDNCYSFDRDLAGNLWFARVVKKRPDDEKNVGAEVYRFDGERTTRYTITGNVLDGGVIDFTCGLASNEAGTVWLYRRVGFDPGKEPIPFAVDAKHEPVTTARPVAEVEKKIPKLIKNAKLSYAVTSPRFNAVAIFDSYTLEVRNAKGKLLHTLKPGDLELGLDYVIDIEPPTFLDEKTLLVPLTDRHEGPGCALYTLDLTDFRLAPHPLNGTLKRSPDKLLFDRKGRLWATHSYYLKGWDFTTFSVVELDRSVVRVASKKK